MAPLGRCFAQRLGRRYAGPCRALCFRTTAVVAYRRLEFYTGYEYTDIGRTHWNGHIGGVRLWF